MNDLSKLEQCPVSTAYAHQYWHHGRLATAGAMGFNNNNNNN